MGKEEDLQNSSEGSRAAGDAAGRRLWAALRLWDEKGQQLMDKKK